MPSSWGAWFINKTLGRRRVDDGDRRRREKDNGRSTGGQKKKKKDERFQGSKSMPATFANTTRAEEEDEDDIRTPITERTRVFGMSLANLNKRDSSMVPLILVETYKWLNEHGTKTEGTYARRHNDSAKRRTSQHERTYDDDDGLFRCMEKTRKLEARAKVEKSMGSRYSGEIYSASGHVSVRYVFVSEIVSEGTSRS